jgi:hypothetical protein
MATLLSSLFLSSPSGAPRLRVGVMVDSLELPRCFAAVLKDIQDSNFAELTVLIENTEAAQEVVPEASRLKKLARTITDPYRRRHALFSAYEGLLEPKLRYADDPLEEIDIGAWVAGVSVLKVAPLRSKFVHRFPEDALAALRSLKLDVIIRFGFNVLRGAVLTVARYGVWSYHHGDNEFYRGLPPGFWEMAEGNPLTGVILQHLTEALDAGHTLARAQFTTHSAISKARNCFGPYWGAEHFVIQKLMELHRDGWAAVLARAVPTPVYQGKRALYRRPTNTDVARWAATRVLPTIAKRIWVRRSVETWRIGIRQSKCPLYEDSSQSVPFRWIVSPKGHFWADPCVVQHQGSTHLFFEDYDYASAKGVIGCAEVFTDGTLGPPATVLERPYHLSYPLVFTHQGELYMIPETSAAGVIELYRAQEFPARWVRERTLIELPGLDSTPFYAQGQWWLLTTPLLGQHHAAVTLLFSAPELMGPWTHHPASPISTDVRVARSAGAVLVTPERLIRVSQDCATGYGQKVVFSEITQLTATHYAERPLAIAAPQLRHQTGMHTYSRAGMWEVIDGKWRLPTKEIL